MNKTAIALIVLLLAGIGLALVAGSRLSSDNASSATIGCMENCKGSCANGSNASSCICPNNGSCREKGSAENCTGPSARKAEAATQSSANSPRASCASAGANQAGCAINSAPICAR